MRRILLILPFLLYVAQVCIAQKMNGVSFVSPPRGLEAGVMKPIKDVGANWIAISPFAFSRAGEPAVTFNSPRQWWGERAEGVAAIVKAARTEKLKVMLKPHVWVREQGWAGDFTLTSESDWKVWEQSYEIYILTMARLADSLRIELFCVGTEYRKATTLRPQFWKSLIAKVRAVYKGKLTYAANWDEYEDIAFWSDLDYIGINAYFPLVDSDTPSVTMLLAAWKVPALAIKTVQQKFSKPVIFTEYGYQSTNRAVWKQWELEGKWFKPVNLAAQVNGYEALYQAVWREAWFAGGFIWKWYPKRDAGGESNTDYTPQRKPVEATIQKWYRVN
ncbi:MAG: hypothetical protein IAF08_15455 [Rhizobacter sp.]|nr:hypothetical protein [Chlorobiales bacterium]